MVVMEWSKLDVGQRKAILESTSFSTRLARLSWPKIDKWIRRDIAAGIRNKSKNTVTVSE